MGTLRFFEEVVSFKIRRTFGFADYNWLLNGEGPMLNVVHYPAMEGGNELLVNDQAYYVGRPAGSDEVLIPRDAWEVIKKQADSFKERDEQMNRVISLLEKQMDKGK